MITQTVTVTAKDSPNIIIGRRGEYEAEEIIFDASYMSQLYGDGSAILMVKRPSDAYAYPAVTVQEGSTITWLITETDTSFKGHGECELYWYVDDALAKSVIFGITVLRDIGNATEEPPDPYETWVDEIARLSNEAHSDAERAETARDGAEAAEARAEAIIADAITEAQIDALFT